MKEEYHKRVAVLQEELLRLDSDRLRDVGKA